MKWLQLKREIFVISNEDLIARASKRIALGLKEIAGFYIRGFINGQALMEHVFYPSYWFNIYSLNYFLKVKIPQNYSCIYRQWRGTRP